MINLNYRDVKITHQVRSMKKADGILLTVTGFVFRPGKLSVKYGMDDDRYTDFLLYIATELVATIVNAIDNQRYSHKWKPLSAKYLSYKKAHHLSLKIWEATSHMKKSIRVFKQGKFVAMGFDNRTIYPKSLIKVNLVARFLEFGSRDNHRPPSRPLWRPLQIYVRKNIYRYYKSYIKELQSRNLEYLWLKR
jgi:hypothetical protein